MFRLFFLLIVSFSALFSNEFYLNPYFQKQLKKDTNSYNILKDYVKFLNKISSLDRQQQIEKINSYINAIVPKYDIYNYKNEEYWATPFEFFAKGGGDCEDYVIAKKYTLHLLGIPSKDMYFNIVKEKYIGGDHMVLSLYVKKKNTFLVLDNLSTIILPFDKRIDLKSTFLFNENGFFRFGKNKKFVKIDNIDIPAYIEMKERDKNKLVLVR